jgi:hypothetical protein
LEASLPFRLLGVDSDNGGEFINHHLVAYLGQREAPVLFTRSRPYKKNDNAHVEQRNWTHVREHFGYERYDVSARSGGGVFTTGQRPGVRGLTPGGLPAGGQERIQF